MIYIKQTTHLFKSVYLAVAGIALIFWVFGVGSNDSDESHSGPGLIPRAHADDPASSACSGCGSCTSGCGCCFLPNAKIAVEGGVVAISEIKVGDKVVSYDETTGAFGFSIVEKVLRHNTETGDVHDFATHPLVKIICDNGKELIVTSNHPIFDAATKVYRPVEDFAIGDKLMTREGEVAIVSKEKLDEQEYLADDDKKTVYNLSLTDGPPTYIAEDILVHNKGNEGPSTCGPY